MKKTIIREAWQFNKSVNLRFIKDFGPKKPGDITFIQSMILIVLCDHEEENLGAKDLIEIFSLSKATISEALSALVDKGYIEINIDQEDRRRKNLILTPLAQAYSKDAYRKFAKMEEDMSHDIEEEDLKVFRKVLKQMEKNMVKKKR